MMSHAAGLLRLGVLACSYPLRATATTPPPTVVHPARITIYSTTRQGRRRWAA